MKNITEKRIIDLIEKRNINQKILSKAIGTTEATLSRNLNSVHEIRADILEKIAKYFNVSTDYLLGNTDNPNAVKLKVANQDGTITGIEYELLNKVKGFTTDDLEKVLDYVDYIKSKKDGKNEK